MKSSLLSLIALITLCALIAGCASGAKRIETGGRQSITTVDTLDIQDFIDAGHAATDKLLASGVLDKVPNPPAILAMSMIVNNTGQQIDTDLLTKRIRVRLNESGKALTTTTQGLGGAEDPHAAGRQEEAEFLNDPDAAPVKINFSLSGKIIQTVARAGSTRQSTFSFQLSLTDNRGLALWEGEEEITKQGKRATVGF